MEEEDDDNNDDDYDEDEDDEEEEEVEEVHYIKLYFPVFYVFKKTPAKICGVLIFEEITWTKIPATTSVLV
jgi:hypothetical protein